LWEGILLPVAIVGLLLSPVLASPASIGQAEGTITAVDSGSVTLMTRTGSRVRVGVTRDTLVIQRKLVNLQDIKPNDYVGVTARREADGTLTAISINIFPPEFKARVRPAQFLLDTGHTMTNATVFQNVRRIEGRTLYLRLPEGSAVITAPKETQVFRLTVGKFSDLKPGMQVMVRGTTGSDGSLTASSINVEVR